MTREMSVPGDADLQAALDISRKKDMKKSTPCAAGPFDETRGARCAVDRFPKWPNATDLLINRLRLTGFGRNPQ